jgi:hypothetical protein
MCHKGLVFDLWNAKKNKVFLTIYFNLNLVRNSAYSI